MVPSVHAAHASSPLSGRSINVEFIQHPGFLEAKLHGFVNFDACKVAVRLIGEEIRRTCARRVLIDTGGVIGQLTRSEHAALGEHLAPLFGSARVAAIAPIDRPVGEIAPTARKNGADYLGFRTRAEALEWLLQD